MREKRLRSIVTFYTTAEAFACEKACLGKINGGKLISAPRRLSADCGIAYRCETSQRDEVEAILNANEIEYQGIFEVATY